MNAMTPGQREDAARRGYAQEQERQRHEKERQRREEEQEKRQQEKERADLIARLDREIERVLDLATEEAWKMARPMGLCREVRRGKLIPRTVKVWTEEFCLCVIDDNPSDTTHTHSLSSDGELWYHYYFWDHVTYRNRFTVCRVRDKKSRDIDYAIRGLQQIQSVDDFPRWR